MTFKQKRILADHISKVASALQIEASVVVHFINMDLERICRERLQIDDLRLSSLDAHIDRLKRTAADQDNDLQKKEALLKKLTAKVEETSALIDSKNASLAKTQEEVESLETRLAELDSSLREASRAKRQVEFDRMMTGHRHRELTDKKTKINKIILSLFTLLGIAIATALAWKLLK